MMASALKKGVVTFMIFVGSLYGVFGIALNISDKGMSSSTQDRPRGPPSRNKLKHEKTPSLALPVLWPMI